MVDWFTQATQNNSLMMTKQGVMPYRFGIKITALLSGNDLNTATFDLCKYQTPNGIVTAKLYETSGSNLVLREASSTSYNNTDLSAHPTFTTYPFTFTGITVAENDYIMVETTGTTVPDDAILAGTNTAANPCYYTNNPDTTVDEFINRQTTCTFSSGGAPTSSGTRLPPPPITLSGL
jgi:hypothetical protein